MIRTKDYKYFDVAAAGPESIIVSDLFIRFVRPKNERLAALDSGFNNLSESNSNGGIITNTVIVPTRRYENIKKDSKVYLKISTSITYETIPLRLGTLS